MIERKLKIDNELESFKAAIGIHRCLSERGNQARGSGQEPVGIPTVS